MELADTRADRDLFHRWWHSRLGGALARELLLVLGLLAFYKYGRFLVRDQAQSAFDHARELMHVERALSIFNEARLQELALEHGATVLRALNGYYLYAHVVVTAVVFFWLFVRHPREYVRFRRVMILMTLVGLVLHLLVPLAPPRMFPHLGFVDTGAIFGPASYGNGSAYKGFANEFAALPSLHFGWALAVAWATILALRSRWRFVVLLHPVLTLAAIVITANHFWLDAVAAAALFVAGLEADYLLRRRSARSAAEAGSRPRPRARAGAAPGAGRQRCGECDRACSSARI